MPHLDAAALDEDPSGLDVLRAVLAAGPPLSPDEARRRREGLSPRLPRWQPVPVAPEPRNERPLLVHEAF